MYKYRVRLGYNSSEFLIDFMVDDADDLFFGTLFDALAPLNVSNIDLTDLWVNDEVILLCKCNVGEFEIIRDVYDLVFIMAPNHQRVIECIGKLLEDHEAFLKQNFSPSAFS